jgi:UDP-N-acetylglucosamine:LPS N-acetylglucosamine transferase
MYDQSDSVLVFGGYSIDMALCASITLKLPVILVVYNPVLFDIIQKNHN